MAIFKCKMCGGALEINENQAVVTCKYCGSQQTLPKVDDEKKLALFNRANNLRIKNEFDKAAGIYESIIAEFPEEAEAYWGLVLCKYGIEYVDDPASAKKVPTCHRTLPTPIMRDEDFQQACENADISARGLYREEAKAIDGIQKKILEIAATEEPYDVFICYKETDDVTGTRTEDSSIAQDIYTAFTEMGYKVFYARNSLRKVAGTEYEPYIYAALSSAKVMIAIGTKYEYYDAVWVKNEWSRFISMMANDSSKVLIPCFKNIDAYDIPEEFSNMQALDMADMMFFSSLEASVKRVLSFNKPTVNSSADGSALTMRGYIYIEDGDFVKADSYFDRSLDENPMDSKAYIGKVLASLRLTSIDDLNNILVDLSTFKDFDRALKFAEGQEKRVLEEIKEKTEQRMVYKKLATAFSKLAAKKAALEKKEKEEKERAFIVEAGVLKKYTGASVDIELPEKISTIGEGCFKNTQIKSVVIPNTVVSIAERAFDFCPCLTSINVNEGNLNYSSVDGVLFDKSRNKLITYPAGKTSDVYSVPDTVKVIERHAFFRCTGLTSIIIPNSVTNIGNGAFSGCSNILSVVIPFGVSSIADFAFSGCTNLKSITIPDSVASIGRQAFSECISLTSINIPDSVTTISGKAFFNCTSLVSIKISNKVTIIDEGTFYNCTSLTSVTLPNSLRSIGNSAFLCCTSLVSVSLPNGITNIDKAAFYSCTQLSSITIPGSVTSIGELAFERCSNLKTIHISDDLLNKSSKALPVLLYKYLLENKRLSEAKRLSEQQEQLQTSYRSKGLCQYCGGEFKGLFSKKCVKCGKPKDY